MTETFMSLLQDRAHWEFELFLMILFDGIVAGILWPFVRLHWRHHIDRDRREFGPKWKRRAGEVTDDGVNTWTNAGKLRPVVTKCNHPNCTGHLVMPGGQTQHFGFGPAVLFGSAEKPAKTMDTPRHPSDLEITGI